MWNRPRLAVAKGLRIAAMAVAGAFTATATVPTGWYLAGSKPAEYESGVDAEALRAGYPSAYLKAGAPKWTASGADAGFSRRPIPGQESAAQRVGEGGRRATVGGIVDARGQGDRRNAAGIRQHAEPADPGHRADWKNYDVVLDVPQDAAGIFFGVLLTGPGRVWLNGVKFEVVGPDVPTTGRPQQQERPDKPTNLDFQN